MTFKDMMTMPIWRLQLITFKIQLNVVSKSIYDKKLRGRPFSIKTQLRYFYSISWCIFRMIIFTVFLGWRAQVFLSSYCWFRRIDDVIDKDSEAPCCLSIEGYVKQKYDLISYVNGSAVIGIQPRVLPEDILILYIDRICTIKGINVLEEAACVFNLMSFDAWRIHGGHIVTALELKSYAVKQDVALLRASIKILGGNVSKFDRYSDDIDGILTQCDWFIDIPKDIPYGIVNISQDEIESFNICLEDISRRSCYPDLLKNKEFKKWFIETSAIIGFSWIELEDSPLFSPTFAYIFNNPLLNIFLYRWFKLQRDRFEYCISQTN